MQGGVRRCRAGSTCICMCGSSWWWDVLLLVLGRALELARRVRMRVCARMRVWL